MAIIAAVCLGAVAYWYGGTPRVGRSPHLRSDDPTSIEITVADRPLTTITNVADLTAVMNVLRTGHSVPQHECKARGKMILGFADGEVIRMDLLPGHHFLRFEFAAPGGLFAVSRSRFFGALKAAGVQVHKIPTE